MRNTVFVLGEYYQDEWLLSKLSEILHDQHGGKRSLRNLITERLFRHRKTGSIAKFQKENFQICFKSVHCLTLACIRISNGVASNLIFGKENKFLQCDAKPYLTNLPPKTFST